MDFRHFVISEDKDFMLGAVHHTPFSLPQPVINVLNAVDAKDRHDILKWIMGEGLRKSLLARRDLANQLKAAGYNLGQDGVFSPTAYKKLGVPPEIQDKIEKVWHSTANAEPTFIPIHDSEKLGQDEQERKGYNLADINSHLISLGQQPLYFGGKDGLIEYIEDGKWRTGDYKHKDINKNSRYGKQGHDLSLPADTDVLSNIGDENNPSYTYKYGLGGGMHIDPNSTAWNTYLDDSERFSKNKILSIIKKQKNGEELSPEEEEILKRYNISTVAKPHNLRDIAGLNPRATKTSLECPTCGGTNKNCENCHGTGIVAGAFTHWDDEEDYIKAKACIKAYVTWMFSNEPATGEQNLTPGKISKRFTAPGVNIPDINNMNPETAINHIMKAIFPNDSKRLMANSPYLEYYKDGKRKRNRIPIPNLLFGSDEKQNGNKALRWYLQNHPSIDIDVNGKGQSIDPQEIVNFKKDKDVLHYSGNVAPGKIGKKLVAVDFTKLNDEGYVLDRKKTDAAKDGRQIWELPGTGQIKVLFPKNGEWFEYQPNEGKEVDVTALTSSNWSAEKINSPYNKDTLYQMTSPDGAKTMLIRKSVEPSGKVRYFEVPQLKNKNIEGSPLLGGRQITPNAGKTGVKHQMYPFDPETGESGGENWDKAVEDFKKWNPTGLRDTVRFIKGDDAGSAISHVLHQIDNMGFWYGSVTGKGKENYIKLLSKKEIDPDALAANGWTVSTGAGGNRILLVPPANEKDKKKTWAYLDQKDGKWYEDVDGSANLNPEEAQEVFKVIKDEVFGNKKQVEVLPDSSEQLYDIQPDAVYFRKEIVNTIKQMGNRWRQSKATNWAETEKAKNAPQARGSGSGSEEDDWDQAADLATSDDDSYDDAPYAGEDEEEIRYKGSLSSNDGEDDLYTMSNISDDEADAQADEFLKKARGSRRSFVSDTDADTRKKKALSKINFPMDIDIADPLSNAPSAEAKPIPVKVKKTRKPKVITGAQQPSVQPVQATQAPTPQPIASNDFDFDFDVPATAAKSAPLAKFRKPTPTPPSITDSDPFDFSFESVELSRFAKRLREINLR